MMGKAYNSKKFTDIRTKNTKLTSVWKKSENSSYLILYFDILDEGRKNLHCLGREARNSAFDFGSSTLLLDHPVLPHYKDVVTFQYLHRKKLSLGSLVRCLPSSYEDCSGRLGIGRS